MLLGFLIVKLSYDLKFKLKVTIQYFHGCKQCITDKRYTFKINILHHRLKNDKLPVFNVLTGTILKFELKQVNTYEV